MYVLCIRPFLWIYILYFTVGVKLNHLILFTIPGLPFPVWSAVFNMQEMGPGPFLLKGIP